MTFTGKATYDDAAMDHEDVSDLVSINAQLETPTLDFLGDGDEPATNILHEWNEDDVNAITDTINEGGAFLAADTTLTVTDGSKFCAGMLIGFEGYDEIMWVSAVSTNDLTIVRSIGTPAAETSVADGTTIHILGMANLEGDDAPDSIVPNMTRTNNYTQIIAPPSFKISATAMATKKVGGMNEYDRRKEQRVKEALRMLERLLINGDSNASAGSSTAPRTFTGIKHLCSTNVYDESSATLTRARFDAITKDMWDNGADAPEKLVLCGSFQKQIISSFGLGAIQKNMDDDRFRVKVDKYENDFGTWIILLNRWVHTGEIVITTPGNVKVIPLSGRSFFHRELPELGSYKHGMIEGEYTVEGRHEETHAWIHTLATS